MKILFTGGGTLGSVAPLIAVYEKLSRDGLITPAETLWIGTRTGPEREVVQKAGIRFVCILSGKIRRYLHWRNSVDPLFVIIGFFQALTMIIGFRPAVIINAGSFVGLPVLYAGRLFHKKIIIMQLDLVPTRSNLLAAPIADRICVAVPEIQSFFPQAKTVVSGIPVRIDQSAQVSSSAKRGTIVITGGGTGARALNEIVLRSLDRLTSTADVIHFTGKKKEGSSTVSAQENPRYYPKSFVTGDEMIATLTAADIVVSRAGMGTLAELAALQKPSIIIPIPHSPQEENAAYFGKHNAALVLSQEHLTPSVFADTILNLLNNEEQKKILVQNIAAIFPPNAAAKVASIITEQSKESYD